MDIIRPPKSFLELNGAVYPLDQIGEGQFRTTFVPDLVSYRGKACIKVVNANMVWRGTLPVAIEDEEGEHLKVVCQGTLADQRRLASVMKWASGNTSFFADAFDDELVELARNRHPLMGPLKTLALGGLATLLIALIAFVATLPKTSFEAELAFIGFPSTALKATTAGEIVYLRQDGTVERGELFASLKTPAGFAKFIESTQQGTIASVAAKPGTFVQKGTTLMRLADADARPYIAAFVRQDQLKQALEAKTITVTFTRSDHRLQFSGDDGFYPRNRRLISNETGAVLAEVEFSLPEGTVVPRGEPLSVEFIAADQDARSFVRQQWQAAHSLWQKAAALWDILA